MSNVGRINSDPSLQPLAPPPATPPPPPPPNGETQPLLSSTSTPTSFLPPTITNYGDVTLEPNTGETNAFQDEVVGLALSEMIHKIQWSSVLSAFCVVVWEVVTLIFFPIQMITVGLAQVVLTAYLLFFALLLLQLEIFFTSKVLYNMSLVPEAYMLALVDNFGFLFHPLKKSAFILWLAFTLLLISKRSIIEYILGIWWILNSVGTIYTYIKYPEFRRQTNEIRTTARQKITAETRTPTLQDWSEFATFVWKGKSSTAPTSTDV